MAYIFKSIAATQFLSNMLFMYFFVNCNVFKFHNCCSMYKWVMATLLLLLVKMWKIRTISQTVRDREISSKLFEPQGSTRVSYAKGKMVWWTLAYLLTSSKWVNANYL